LDIETNNEKELKEQLENLDYDVKEIPRGNLLSADYVVKLGSVSSIIEVKTMNDTDDAADQYFSKLKSGDVFQHINIKNTRKNISKAFNQVATSYKNLEANGYKLICIYSNTIDSRIDVRRRIFDFYGVCELFGMRLNQSDFSCNMDFKTCYGFYNSIFLEYKSLGGAIIISPHEKLFLPNLYSEKYQGMIESDFLKPVSISTEWEIYDPIKQEKDGEALILDDEALSVRNNNLVELTDILNHERSQDVIDAKKYLTNKYNYTQLSMEQNRNKSLVIGRDVS